ncbi:MAG: hypothetical protein F9K29_10620 [Hyphomicrobiaceae bacterium]|nr:MAG: hypothetical protein F9K29_10620 [Hyphomicrobiaceae bacterium]
MRRSCLGFGLLACLGFAGCATPAIDRPPAAWTIAYAAAGPAGLQSSAPAVARLPHQTTRSVRISSMDEEAIIARAIAEHEMRRP